MGIMKSKILLFLFALIGVTACGGAANDVPKDGPATGSIQIGVDESFSPLIRQRRLHLRKIIILPN
jgi:hypothetical protein